MISAVSVVMEKYAACEECFGSKQYVTAAVIKSACSKPEFKEVSYGFGKN
jgi:hypothetical protein